MFLSSPAQRNWIGAAKDRACSQEHLVREREVMGKVGFLFCMLSRFGVGIFDG